MGTNFYMITTNKDLAETYFPDEYTITDVPYFGYEIHIGKRSAGWMPLFEGHKNAYGSVKAMKQFIKDHSDDIRIFDEYSREFSLEQLEDELITWADQQPIRYIKHIPNGVPDEVFGGKKYLVESTEDDYDITIPYDHLEYEKLEEQRYGFVPYKSHYWRDKDGFNFMDGDFE